MSEALAAAPADDRLARRNALILAVAQACYGIAVTLVIALGGVVGHALAFDKSLSTLPITTMMIGTTIGVIPASLFMQRFGRRSGFIIGAGAGVAGSLLAAQAILAGSFWLFCLATHFLGYYQATAGYYRFAAADTATPEFRPKAISYALGGGLAGALSDARDRPVDERHLPAQCRLLPGCGRLGRARRVDPLAPAHPHTGAGRSGSADGAAAV